MAGGLMQLVATGQQNIILNGNPSRTFWKAAYKKYTNYSGTCYLTFYYRLRTVRLKILSFFSWYHLLIFFLPYLIILSIKD